MGSGLSTTCQSRRPGVCSIRHGPGAARAPRAGRSRRSGCCSRSAGRTPGARRPGPPRPGWPRTPRWPGCRSAGSVARHAQRRVVDARLGEAPGPQHAGVAGAAGRVAALVARPGQVAGARRARCPVRTISALVRLDQRGADGDRVAFDPPLLAGGRHPPEGLDELGTAVGVPGVVDGVDPDPDGVEPAGLGHAEGHGQEDAVASGHVGDRDAVVVPPAAGCRWTDRSARSRPRRRCRA